MTSNEKTKRSQLAIEYQLSENEELEKLNRAFDLLFEQVLKNSDDLTINGD